MSKRKLHRNPSEPNELKAMALAGECSRRICSKNCLELIGVVQQQELNKLTAVNVDGCVSGGRGDTATLRSAKSEESLSSLHNVEGNYL